MRRFLAGLNGLDGKSKAQSAMEYLMTYGWAILIIAVVMVALFALGVFNGANFGPRATAGACQVVRNVESVTLQGQCQGELPMYAAYFNGQTSSVEIPYSPALQPLSHFTWAAWLYIEPYQGPPPTKYGSRIYMNGGGGSSQGWEITVPSSNLGSHAPVSAGIGLGSSEQSLSGSVPTGSWQFLAIAFNSSAGTASMYLNSNTYPIGILSFTPGTDMNAYVGNVVIGAYGDSPFDNFNGSISNVQMYNATLSANDISSLYREGIGGAPIDPLHIVGWWPLNGNANDYSGNSHDGTSASVSYTSSWTSGYTQP